LPSGCRPGGRPRPTGAPDVVSQLIALINHLCGTDEAAYDVNLEAALHRKDDLVGIGRVLVEEAAHELDVGERVGVAAALEDHTGRSVRQVGHQKAALDRELRTRTCPSSS
jgi:hypothetical protein